MLVGVGMQKKDKSVLLDLRLVTDDRRVVGYEKLLAQKLKEPLDNMSDQYMKAAGSLEKKIKDSPSLGGLLSNSFFADGLVKDDKTAYTTVLEATTAQLELQIKEALDVNYRKFKDRKHEVDLNGELGNKRPKKK